MEMESKTFDRRDFSLGNSISRRAASAATDILRNSTGFLSENDDAKVRPSVNSGELENSSTNATIQAARIRVTLLEMMRVMSNF